LIAQPRGENITFILEIMTAINSLLSASSFYSLPAISKKGIQKFPSGFLFFISFLLMA
jgi:4-hydroxybenzoate polyprenyltransferase